MAPVHPHGHRTPVLVAGAGGAGPRAAGVRASGGGGRAGGGDGDQDGALALREGARGDHRRDAAGGGGVGLLRGDPGVAVGGAFRRSAGRSSRTTSSSARCGTAPGGRRRCGRARRRCRRWGCRGRWRGRSPRCMPGWGRAAESRRPSCGRRWRRRSGGGGSFRRPVLCYSRAGPTLGGSDGGGRLRRARVRDAAGAEPGRSLRDAGAALWGAAGLSGVLRGADRGAGGGLGGAAGGPEVAGPAARPRAGLVPAAGDGGLRLLSRQVQRRPAGRARQARLAGGAGRHLRALHAVPEAAAGGFGRRLLGDGLPGDQPRVRHDGGLRGGGDGAPGAGDQPLRRLRAEPHGQGARLGGAGAEGGAEVSGLLPDVRRRHVAEALRGDAGRGLPGQCAGELHLVSGAGQVGLDHLQRAPVGPELGEPLGVPGNGRGDAVPRQQGRGRAEARRGRVHVEADGDALPVGAGGAHAAACAQGGEPGGGARR